MEKINCEIPKDVVKKVADYWSRYSSEDCLLNDIYRLIPGKEDLGPASMSFQTLCELFDFSNTLLGTWKDELTLYNSSKMISNMVVIDGNMDYSITPSINSTDSILGSLIDLRESILSEFSIYTPTASDWEFIVDINISDVCKHLYLLMYGFRNKDDMGTVTGDFKTDIMELYKKVNKYALDMIQSPSGVPIIEQSVSFSVCSKILELINDALFELKELSDIENASLLPKE